MKKFVKIRSSAYTGNIEVLPEVPAIGDDFDPTWTVTGVYDNGSFCPTTDSNTAYRHYTLTLTDRYADEGEEPLTEDRHVAVFEEETQTVEEFVANLFENYTGNPVGMTVDQADDDLRGFRREGWNLPTDITPERYAEEWNRLTAEVEDGNE